MQERGAALVEFALVAPILLAVLVGMISAGKLYNEKLNLTHAAREGARYGSTHAVTDQSWADTVANVVVARSDGDLTGDQVCVALVTGRGAQQTVYNNNSSVYRTDSGPCIADDGNNDGSTRVQVMVEKTGVIQAVLMSAPVTLSSSAIGSYEQ